MIDVFVYGTLRKGYTNHFYLNKAEFLGNATTKEHYGMFGGRIPFVNKNYALYPIEGELYRVTPSELKELDRLEGHPEFYRRERIQVVMNDTNEVVEAFIYFCDYNTNPFKSGNYAEKFPLHKNPEPA